MKSLAAGLLCILMIGCAAPLPSAAPTVTLTPSPQRPNLGAANGTTLTVTLVVNGQRVAVFPPGGPDPSIDLTALPPLPWTVEALSPSGRVLTSMRVQPGQVSLARAATGARRAALSTSPAGAWRSGLDRSSRQRRHRRPRPAHRGLRTVSVTPQRPPLPSCDATVTTASGCWSACWSGPARSPCAVPTLTPTRLADGWCTRCRADRARRCDARAGAGLGAVGR